MGKSKAAVSGTALGLGLVMDGLGVVELLGLANVGLFPDIRVNWPVIMLLIGTSITIFSLTWIGYGMWENRPAARFHRLYAEVRLLRDAISGDTPPHRLPMNYIVGSIVELKEILQEKYGISCPRSPNEWQDFLCLLTPLTRAGDLTGARKLLREMKLDGTQKLERNNSRPADRSE